MGAPEGNTTVKSRKENNTAGTVKRELHEELEARHEEPERDTPRGTSRRGGKYGTYGKRVKKS